MRIIKKLAAFSLAGVITFGLGVVVQRGGSAAKRYFFEPTAWRVLLSFENQDLQNLDEESMHAVNHAIEMTTGQSDADQFLRFEPRIFRKISNTRGEPRYILVEEKRLAIIPGTASVRVHIFDTDGKVLSSTQFDTGNRMAIIAMRIRRDHWMDKPTLVINSEYWLGEHTSHQVYAVVENELRLAYISAPFGIASNNYRQPILTIGPRLNLSADDWERELQSTDDARVLSALTWLAGSHWEGQEAPYDEDRPDGEKVKDLRARESVRRRLNELTNSKNFFIEHAAKAMLENK